MKTKHSIIEVKGYIGNLHYYAGLVFSKILDKTGKMLTNEYIKTTIILLLIVFLSYQFSKRIALEHLRTVIIFSIFFLLAAASISLKSGIIALIIYLPFMAFIRRYIYVYGRYVAMDPILIISDVITIWMFGYLIIFKGKEIYKLFRENKLVKFATILLFVFIMQMFNPKQGSILVGIGGAKFYIVPFMWFYFGLFLDKKFMKQIFVLIVFIGFITALYGLKQTFFGFTPFEEYWVHWGGYSALHLLRIIRSFSTFASAGEYAHYLTISGIICFAFFLKSRQKITFLVALTIIVAALFIAAVRSAIFTFVFSSIILVGFLVKDKKKGVLVSIALLLLIALFISKAGFTPEVNEYSPLSVTSYHAVRGLVNPMEESSLQSRFHSWFFVFPRLMIRNPFGYGIGSISLAGWKFGSHLMATENLFLDIVLGSGIVGAILFVIVLINVFSYSVALIKENTRKMLGILGITVPLSFLIIGSSSEYTIFPIIWLLWGVIAKEATR